MSIFCKRRGADNFFHMVNLPSVFTFYLFWVKVPLSQHRIAEGALFAPLLLKRLESAALPIGHEPLYLGLIFEEFSNLGMKNFPYLTIGSLRNPIFIMYFTPMWYERMGYYNDNIIIISFCKTLTVWPQPILKKVSTWWQIPP